MRTSEEIEAEVEASRNNLDRNVEALKQKMTPGQLFDEAARMMGGAGQQVASRFADQAKANPMPLAVMGLGLAWLMMSNTQRQAGPAYGFDERRSFAATPFQSALHEGDGSGESLKNKAHALGDKVQGLVSGVQDKVANASASAADAGRSAGEGLSSMASNVRDKAGEVGQQAQRTFQQTLEREPLLLAGLGLVVGAVIGAALPRTEVEDRAMGETRDHLIDKGKDLAQAGIDKAGAAAHATYDAVKSELSNNEGADAADRLAAAARTGVQTAQDTLQGPSH